MALTAILFACLLLCVSAQETSTIKRGDAISAPTPSSSTSSEDVGTTERGIWGGGGYGGGGGSSGGVDGLVDNILGIVNGEVVETDDYHDECLACSKLGHLDVFDFPLFTDCDVHLLESLFDPDFEYGTRK